MKLIWMRMKLMIWRMMFWCKLFVCEMILRLVVFSVCSNMRALK